MFFVIKKVKKIETDDGIFIALRVASDGQNRCLWGRLPTKTISDKDGATYATLLTSKKKDILEISFDESGQIKEASLCSNASLLEMTVNEKKEGVGVPLPEYKTVSLSARIGSDPWPSDKKALAFKSACIEIISEQESLADETNNEAAKKNALLACLEALLFARELSGESEEKVKETLSEAFMKIAPNLPSGSERKRAEAIMGLAKTWSSL